MPQVVTLSFPEPDIALLTLDDPSKGANILARPVLEEIAGHLEALETRTELAGLIFRSLKPGIFIAGADIREFAAAENITKTETIALATEGRRLFERLNQTPFVTVAAIDGICVGGGAELAVWCDRRLMTDSPKTQIGFPEVKLGLFPGWGGTVRTPRIVGLSNAVELITGGESIDAKAAVLMGLATDVVPTSKAQSPAAGADQLLQSAIGLVRGEKQTGDYLRDRERWSKPITMSETELGFLGATGSAYITQMTKGQYPAPIAALNLMLEASQSDAETAGVQEAEAFAELFGTPINRALINVFLLTDRNKKDTGVADRNLQPKKIKSVGVIGAGIMGSGITGATIKRELPVTLTDARPESLAGGMRKAVEEASYDKVAKGPTTERLLKFAPLVRAVVAESEFARCDLVIEAVVENEKAKRELYSKLEQHLADDAILASNTSAISIGRLASGLKHPERFCGIHFFNPVRKMPLVEVIRGPQSSDQTIATAVAFAKGLGKSPIVVEDGPGFLVNRLLFPYMNEALELLVSGVPIKAIDGAAKAFGMPMGPITLYDVVGLDTALFAGAVMHEAFPERVLASPLLEAMVKAGRLGQKSKAGFFAYKEKSDRGEPDPAFDEFLAKFARPGAKDAPKLDGKAVTERLFLPMLLEATRVLEEKKVRDPRDVDLGLIFGIGFPPFKGGLLHWADTLGAAKIIEMLKPYEELGARFRPTPLLLELAKSGKKFYELKM
jgi:3-hydroxyacyl-CoA dehydrogenase/enoyl-CoA hydratase/3-hydroxybutyryl-CoA epimerase/3-hydroxyacyl-CoA dehydrogenase/enoyl-CoA hydratase/3-hydroxybutyryl-CoA epimerase/enoyl-CoA isomerase